MRQAVIITALFVLLAPLSTRAQGVEQRAQTITGVVRDAKTGETLPGASVFLDGTERGDAADREGRFRLRAIPPGNYKLIASMVGYQTQERRLTLPDTAAKPFRFRLQPATMQLPGVTVRGDRSQWLERLERFKRSFLGLTKNAAQVTLENPEVLGFEVDDATETLTATANRPLLIINKALGYKIEYHLKSFEVRGDLHSTFEQSFVHGYGKFEALTPSSEEERRGWREERRRAYHGSLVHFLRATVAGALAEEGFRVYRTNERKVQQLPNGSVQPSYGRRIRHIETLHASVPSPTSTRLLFG